MREKLEKDNIMSDITKIIKTELKKGGKIYIQELKRELGAQLHRATDRLYNSFKPQINEMGGSLSLEIVSSSSYLWIVNNGAANGVQVEADVVLEWMKRKGLTGSMSQGEALRFARNTARQLSQGYYTPGGKLVAPNRYFFVEIAMHNAESMGVITHIEEAIGKQIESVMGWDKPEAVLNLNVS